MSKAPSGAALASVEHFQAEEAEGLDRNLNSSSSRKPDSSKNIKVQEAVATEVPCKGESCCFNLQRLYFQLPVTAVSVRLQPWRVERRSYSVMTFCRRIVS